jgi:hypothetical protein
LGPRAIPADLADSRAVVGRRRDGERERAVAARIEGRRFQREPVAYTRSLEDSSINQAPPP